LSVSVGERHDASAAALIALVRVAQTPALTAVDALGVSLGPGPFEPDEEQPVTTIAVAAPAT
jgi:hypothetical protein